MTHPPPEHLLEVQGRGFTEVTCLFRTNQRTLFKDTTFDVTIKDASGTCVQLKTCMYAFVHP